MSQTNIDAMIDKETNQEDEKKGPSCACGKTDLYEEMHKNREKQNAKNKEVNDSLDSETVEQPKK